MSSLSSAINGLSTTDEKEDGLRTIKINKKINANTVIAHHQTS